MKQRKNFKGIFYKFLDKDVTSESMLLKMYEYFGFYLFVWTIGSLQSAQFNCRGVSASETRPQTLFVKQF